MKLSIGLSPCPNDTFIFYALLHGKIPIPGFQFEPFIADVEDLNQRAYTAELSITKISFNAYLGLSQTYQLLDSGAALGRNCGPLLICKEKMDAQDLEGCTVAIPGEKTTANFLLDTYLDQRIQVNKQVALFSDIEALVLKGKVNAGVIIHENRFTYMDRGLHLIQDLGAHWEAFTGHPIPLGGIIAQRTLTAPVLIKLSRAIRDSIAYAWAHPEEVIPYVRQFAQEMDESVMQKHINLYVNDFSNDLGPMGRKAISRFFEEAVKQKRIPDLPVFPIFLS